MGNALGEELTDKVVVLKEEVLAAPYRALEQRLFRVTGGFGAHNFTSGTALFGEFLADGETCRMDGWDVERLATDEEVQLVTGQELKEKTDD